VIENQPVLGVIYAPMLDELYFSDGENSFARFNDFSEKNCLKLPLLPLTDRQFTILASNSHMNDKTKLFIDELKKPYVRTKIINKGSSLKFCLVASGEADTYPRFVPTMEWESAAGHAICLTSGKNMYSLSNGKPGQYQFYR
jgi:3'(2'), 5'-bisphosphate nucleotidase